MATSAESPWLGLLEVYFDSLTAFRARAESACGPGPAAYPQPLLAWMCKDEPAASDLLTQWDSRDEPALALVLGASVACLTFDTKPPVAWLRRLAASDDLPPWAASIAALVGALAVADVSTKLDKATSAVCRSAIERIAALNNTADPLMGAAALIEARLHADADRCEAALQAYETATSALERSPYVPLHALALQHAGRYCSDIGLLLSGSGFRHAAAQRYMAWGSPSRAGDAHAEPTVDVATATESNHESSRFGSDTEERARRDLRAAIIATQAIADQGATSVVERIVGTLTSLSGAGRVALLMEEQGKLVAEIDTENTPENLPLRLLAYAIRSGAPVLLPDLAVNTFDDPWFETHKTGSLLCVPWQQTTIAAGVVLLENRVLAHAFSQERIGVVHFLAITAATAAIHARLRTDMEATIAQRIQSGNEALERARHIRRSNSEMQMAGGFAHEMRNSLSATRMLISNLVKCSPQDPPGVMDDDVALVETCLASLSAPDKSFASARHVLDELRTSAEMAQSTCDVIAEGLDRGLNVARVIMDFGRIASDREEQPSAILDPLLQTCMAQFTRDPTLETLTWSVDVPPDLALPLGAKHATAVLHALLSNAVEACSVPGSAHPRIEVEAARRGDALLVRVTDNGCGMSQDIRERAFDPFFSTKQGRNLGLGLTMARKIAHLYGGDVHLTSTSGQGSTVELRLSA